jgi:hypothetical protein
LLGHLSAELRLVSKSSGAEENHAPVVLTRRVFASLPEIERKDMLSSVMIVKDDECSDAVEFVLSYACPDFH